jgi:hypothetical protein
MLPAGAVQGPVQHCQGPAAPAEAQKVPTGERKLVKYSSRQECCESDCMLPAGTVQAPVQHC